MKRQHTYEEIMGGKLNRLASPNVAGLWENMEAMLDREMPQQEKKKRRGAGWFNPNMLIAASLVLVIGGVYTFNSLTATASTAQPGTNALLTEGSHATPATAGDDSKERVVTTAAIENVGSPATVAKAQPAASNRKTGTPVINNNTTQKITVAKGNASATGNNRKNTALEENATLTATPSNGKAVAATEIEETMQLRTATGEQSFAVAEPAAVQPGEPVLIAAQKVKSLTLAGVRRNLGLKKRPPVFVNKGIAFGVALNYPLAVNGQRKNELDMSGKKNAWQDYLPSVFAQLHLSKKFFVQAEWQPVTAQYTPNYTLYHNIDEPSPDEKEEKTVKLNKLYYTSLPLSVHYNTPLKNVSVGLGVQYSLLKKVILQDQEYYHLIGPGRWDVTERKNEVAVKDPKTLNEHNSADVVDAVAKSFRREDWRLLADVGYSYKNFSGGLRYTRGLNPYINSNFTNLPVKARSEALQVYLRVNVFDTRKK